MAHSDEIQDFDDVDDWTAIEDQGRLKAATHGTMLRVSRNRLELSQKDMAKLLRISIATYRNWEQHRTEPDNAAKTLVELLYHHTREMGQFLRDRAA
ncbi:helix-turn-helix domain-containing protein [Carnimonas bestiolae]|uniref:helix-turn-helix domain-containing protein n=1 Tax=Carnimonas bestiolae TaxID=3402172 RepID=UPI003EDB83C7